jgi:hypothetical protein
VVIFLIVFRIAMSSGIELHSITVMNYAEMRYSVLDLMLPYGDAGRECIDDRPALRSS